MSFKLIPVIVIILGVSLSNFWIYWFYKYHFLLGSLLIVENTLLFLSTFSPVTKIVPILTFAIFLILSTYLLVNHFNREVFSVSVEESMQITKRQNYYGYELGKVYQNRVGIFYFDYLRLLLGKYASQFFSPLEWNVYFPSPRLIDYGKYPFILSFFFIVGFVYLLGTIKKTPLIYFGLALVVESLVSLESTMEPLLMFPYIGLCIMVGLYQCGLRLWTWISCRKNDNE